MGIGKNPMMTTEWVAKIGRDEQELDVWVLAKSLKLTVNNKAEFLVLFGAGYEDCPSCFFAHERQGENHWDALIREYQGKYCRYEEIQHIVEEFINENLH